MNNPTQPAMAVATPTPAQIDAMTTMELAAFLASHTHLRAELAAAKEKITELEEDVETLESRDDTLWQKQYREACVKISELTDSVASWKRAKELMKRDRNEWLRLYQEARHALPFNWSPKEGEGLKFTAPDQFEKDLAHVLSLSGNSIEETAHMVTSLHLQHIQSKLAQLRAELTAKGAALNYYAHADFLTTEQQQIADNALKSHAK